MKKKSHPKKAISFAKFKTKSASWRKKDFILFPPKK